MFKEFKQFILRGNVIDLAVGVVIGAAFSVLVSALVKDLLTPLIAALVKVPDFSSLSFTINDSRFMYGDFINAAISFVLVAIAIFLFVVKPVNIFNSRRRASDPETKKCPECLSEIPVAAKRCSHCTQPVG